MSHSAVPIQQLPAVEGIRSLSTTHSAQDLQFQPPWLTETNGQIAVRKILVATDFSAASNRAVETAVSLARQCDASITLLHVVDITAQTVGGRTMPADELMKNLWDNASENMSRLAYSLCGQVNAQTAIEEGLPCEVIIARSRPFDLIVIGRSPKLFWKLFSHHTVERVLQGAACPVIVATEQQVAPIRVHQPA